MKHIGENLYLDTNDVDVIDFLIDNNLFPKKISKSFVITNFDGMDFNIILFNPDNQENKWMLFHFEDFASESETLLYLTALFSTWAKQNYNVFMPAVKKMQELIFMLPTYRALFRYKFNEDLQHYSS